MVYDGTDDDTDDSSLLHISGAAQSCTTSLDELLQSLRKGPVSIPRGPSQHPQGPSQHPEGPSQHPEGPSQHPQDPSPRAKSASPGSKSALCVCMFMCRYVYVGDHMQDLTCELGL